MIKDKQESYSCNTAQMNLLNFLEVLSDHRNIDKELSLCDNIGSLRRKSLYRRDYLSYKCSMVYRFQYICWLWGQDRFFPVPCPSNRPDILNSERAYNLLPKYEGEYGQSRYELLQFALDYQQASLSF